MAASRNKETDQTRSGAPTLDEWKELLPTAALLAGVVAVLLTGLVLQGEPETIAAVRETRPVTATHATLPSSARDTPPLLEPSPEAPDLLRRAASDRERLTGARGRWTLQFIASCDPGNTTVAQATRALAGEPDFYVMAMTRDGRDCFRLCWGLYDSRELAVAARSYPSVLASIPETPRPRPVDELL